MNAVDREAALGGKIRICRPTDVPRFCEHVYRYENDCLGSMYQCANCLAQWKQGRWRAAMHGGPCGTLSCQRNPEADFLREQVHAGGEQRPEVWHVPRLQPFQLALPQSLPQPPQLGLPQSLPQPPQLGLPQSVQDNLPPGQQALLQAQQAMLAVAQQMQLASLAQQLAGVSPLMPPSVIMPGTETTRAGLDHAGTSKGPLGLSASTMALLRQDPSIHQTVPMWCMHRERLARLGLMPLDLSLVGPAPGAGMPGPWTTQTQSESSSVSHAGHDAYTSPPIVCPTGTHWVSSSSPAIEVLHSTLD